MRKKYPRKRDSNQISFYCKRCKKKINSEMAPYKKVSKKPHVNPDKFKATKFVFAEDHYRHRHTNYEQELNNPNGRSKIEIKIFCNGIAQTLMREDAVI